MKRAVALTVFAVASVVLLFGSLAAGDEQSRPSAIRITLTVEQDQPEDGVAQRTYELLAPLKGNASIVHGDRVPIPVDAREPDQKNQMSRATRFSYQDVGFTAKVETRPLEGDRVRLSGYLDISRVRADPGRSSMPPVIETVNQRFDLVLPRSGKVRLLEASTGRSRTISVDLETELLE